VNHGQDLTRHHALPARYLGYPATDWFKFYGFVAGAGMLLCYTYVRHLELFDSVERMGSAEQLFVILFTGIPLLLAAGALLGFNWWAAGGLVKYSKWQTANAKLWRWYWFSILCFYLYVLIDPLDRIHPSMSRLGLGLAPNIKVLFDGKLELFQFQWGYFLLWALFWFLLAILHLQYLADWLREVWFYVDRTHRYSASVLTGFRETLAVYNEAPATSYKLESQDGWAQAVEPSGPGFNGVAGRPYLNPQRADGGSLSEAEAAALLAADRSGALFSAPGQPTVLFVDLGRWDYNPALGALTDSAGLPLLRFDAPLPPALRRDDLVVPLKLPNLAAPDYAADLEAQA
jgi:hypothetical protein